MTTYQADTSGEVTTLAAELRRLRDQAGLSFTALGEQTPYSRSAWQRYLTAKVLPPWPAVRDLCRLAGEPEPRLRALWELAESAVRGRGAVMAEPAPEEEPETGIAAEIAAGSPPRPAAGPEPTTGPPRRERRVRIGIHGRIRIRVRLALALISAVTLAAVGVYLLHGTGGTSSRTTPGTFSVNCVTGPCTPTCQGAACTGQDAGLALCGIQGRPLQQQELAGGIGVEVRYNDQCRAAWARFWNTRVGDALTLTTPGQPVQTIRIKTSKDAKGFANTPMLFVATPGASLRACVTTPTGGSPACFTSSVS